MTGAGSLQMIDGWFLSLCVETYVHCCISIVARQFLDVFLGLGHWLTA